MIGVKNNRPEGKANILTAKYDGQTYEFVPGVTTAISEEAAAHIFGYGEDDKKRALHRLGWVNWGGQLEEGLERLNEFQFLEPEEPKFKEVTQIPRKIAAAGDPLAAPVTTGQPMNTPEADKKQFAG